MPSASLASTDPLLSSKSSTSFSCPPRTASRRESPNAAPAFTSFYTMALFPLDTARSSGAFSNPPHCAGVKTSARRSNAKSPLLLGGLRVQPCSPYLSGPGQGWRSFFRVMGEKSPTPQTRAPPYTCALSSLAHDFGEPVVFLLRAGGSKVPKSHQGASRRVIFEKNGVESMVPTATFCAQSRCLRPPSYNRRLIYIASL